jgi:hypothetical protein
MSHGSRYLILPAQGLQAVANNASSAAGETLAAMADRAGARSLQSQLRAIVRRAAPAGRLPRSAADPIFKIVASVSDSGVKLVESTPEMIAALRFEQPGLRAVREVFYRPARHLIEIRHRLASAATRSARRLAVTVRNAGTQQPIAGVSILGFTDFAEGVGVSATTRSNGQATLRVSGATRFQRLYAQHELPGLWSCLKKNVPTTGELTIELAPLDLSRVDSLRHFHNVGGAAAGSGVRVGVIDSGIDAAHPDLQVAGGLGCVPGSPEREFGASGSHGTHVAGIIAARGAAPTGMSGVAHAAQIFSYRVFDETENSGSSFGLVKAIRQGIVDGCDLLNLSLSFDHDENTGLPHEDEAVRAAILEAHQSGVVVIAAAGNDHRQPVAYPALDDLAIAVSAVGRKGTFPLRSSESGDVMRPYGSDAKNFLAAFSNVGTALDAAAAGVGVVSTVPGGHAPMSGTSMACPAVTGVLARLLGQSAEVRSMPRNADRADAIKALLFGHARGLGLGGVAFEGKGLPR